MSYRQYVIPVGFHGLGEMRAYTGPLADRNSGLRVFTGLAGVPTDGGSPSACACKQAEKGTAGPLFGGVESFVKANPILAIVGAFLLGYSLDKKKGRR